MNFKKRQNSEQQRDNKFFFYELIFSSTHVKFGACAKDKNKTCGTIKTAFRKGAKNSGYENLGKLIVWDMIDKGDGQYANGKIWDPSSNNDDGSKKIYNSKMSLSGNTLSVSGCILIFCKAQNWTKVN